MKQDFELVYPDLSYRIAGILFSVYNQLGYGLKEIVYQRAVAIELREANLNFRAEIYFPLVYENKIVGKGFFDFLIEDKMVLELKRGENFSRKHIMQIYQYLVSADLKLGILACFGRNGVIFKRIVNVNN